MASILEFRKTSLRPRPSPMGGTGSADVVFFPGVRYERTAEEPLPAKSRSRRSRRRDRLDLDD